jgi:uncharacterized protein YndB with AHSA1/START domain
MSGDRIEKKIILRVSLERLWRAVSEAEQFGRWFGVEFDGGFVAGARMTGKIVPTTVDPDIAKMQESHRGKAFAFHVDRIEPMRLFTFRWHPFAIDPRVDYSKEHMTIVTFALEEVPGGAMLTITESGFEHIPLGRRAEAFAANEQGWTAQITLIEKYLALAAA